MAVSSTAWAHIHMYASAHIYMHGHTCTHDGNYELTLIATSDFNLDSCFFPSLTPYLSIPSSLVRTLDLSKINDTLLTCSVPSNIWNTSPIPLGEINLLNGMHFSPNRQPHPRLRVHSGILCQLLEWVTNPPTICMVFTFILNITGFIYFSLFFILRFLSSFSSFVYFVLFLNK